MAVLDRFFFIWGTKKVVAGHIRQVVALDRQSSYTVTAVWEFAWADSALVVLDKWSSYRGGCLNKFDCISLLHAVNLVLSD